MLPAHLVDLPKTRPEAENRPFRGAGSKLLDQRIDPTHCVQVTSAAVWICAENGPCGDHSGCAGIVITRGDL